MTNRSSIDRSTGAWIGQIGLGRLADWPGADKVEVGFELQPAFWGRGLALEGARASLDFGFDVAGLRRIISTTNPVNAPSRRVMEKLGLKYEGRRWYHGHDTVWYSVYLSDWEARRAAPAAGG